MPVSTNDEVVTDHWCKPGPLLLLAGPGTGKTTSLARRIRWLVRDCRVDPENISVITFTREAAANLRAKLSDPKEQDTFLERHAQPRNISTMHSLAYTIIKKRPRGETPEVVM